MKIITLLTCTAFLTQAFGQEVKRNVPYVTNGHERQVLDIYSPANARNLPVVFWVHGGGWQTGDEKTMIALFTDTGCGEALAYSNDRGQHWTYYDKNPVIKHNGRDPKLVWYAPGHQGQVMFADPPVHHQSSILAGGITPLTEQNRP